MVKAGRKDGPSKRYYPSGQLMQEEYWKDDKRDGLDKTYYSNGKLWQEVMWKDGQKVPGTYKQYDEKGNLM
jgi:antitoxin component YwqK of YwqJK toxin-antitoxin module